MKSKTEQCGTCYYGQLCKVHMGSDYVDCLRYPDRVRKPAFGWCGEWKIKKEMK